MVKRDSFIALGAAVIAIASQSSASPPWHHIDLASNSPANGSMTRVYGSTGQGNFGVPVCGGHDCNGDGFRDFAFAQLVADPLQRTNAGMVTLLFGNGQIGAAINTVGFTNSILKIIGDQPYETTGTEIWMDDITGDGIGDLLIGRQNHSPDTNAPGAGALTILVGSSNLTAYAQALSYFDLRNPPTNVAVITIHGAAA